MRGKWMRITRKSGRVIERSTVYVHERTEPRKKKTKLTSAVKQAENEKSAERNLARTLNCNFRPGDALLTLTFEKMEEDSREYAEKCVKAWMRRIKTKLKKQGVTALLRYVYVISDMDGKTGEEKRIHVHILLPHWVKELAVNEWKHGWTDIRHLHEQDDFTDIAAYLLRQVKRVKSGRKYHTAIGMDKPEITIEDIPQNLVLKAGKNEVVMHRSEWEPGMPQYIRTVNMGRKRPAVKPKGRLPD